ncbi:hypothetical protein FB00_05565 [Cellulosimicrobium funkei]|uniref:Uncharacterized protein n=1 Tax=Cellulosimicrobium funkei TaxID=264251 RepID=A0A0H2KQC9_9MICO|nr:hypothetical protein FB00_05565 [Cellulosimicrobium funkei]
MSFEGGRVRSARGRAVRPTAGAGPGGRRRARAAIPTGALAGLTALGLAACAGPGTADARAVVEELAAAVAGGDGTAACALILPDAADALAADEGEPCADVVTAPDGPLAALAAAGDDLVVEDVHVAGRQAQVVTATDTLFLAVSGDGWVVTAAGCTPREDRPYDCEVEA